MPKLSILITGGSGFIGKKLCQHFSHNTIFVLSRTSRPDTRFISSLDSLQKPVDIVINLTGAPISKRWSPSYKRTLTESRLHSTQKLVEWMHNHPPSLFLSASAIGYYGSRLDDTPLDENSPPHDDFTHQLCRQWEDTALLAQQHKIRTCILRIGVVIGKGGGILTPLLTPFSLGLGGPIGKGKQILSWIALDDVTKAIQFLINTPSLSGTFNLTSPNPVSNALFTSHLAKALHRPAFLPMPAPLVRILFGEMGVHLLLRGQCVLPKNLLQNGFSFDFPHIQDALRHTLSS